LSKGSENVNPLVPGSSPGGPTISTAIHQLLVSSVKDVRKTLASQNTQQATLFGSLKLIAARF